MALGVSFWMSLVKKMNFMAKYSIDVRSEMKKW